MTARTRRLPHDRPHPPAREPRVNASGRSPAPTAGGMRNTNELLTLVAAAEADSQHPLAAAIAAGARCRGLTRLTSPALTR
jgi:cation transport ATPase